MRKYKKVHRINLELGPNAFASLELLRESTESSSQVEAVRLALQTFHKLVDEAQAGGKIIVERKDGSKLEIIIPGV